MNPALKEFSDAELRRELDERREKRERAETRRKFDPCDVCIHFIGYKGSGDPPKDFNPCQKGHAMSYRGPDLNSNEQPWNQEWGFFRKRCRDRQKPVVDLSDPEDDESTIHPQDVVVLLP